MIGIDTNLVLRLLRQDSGAQLRAAQKFIAATCSKDEPGYVSRLVVVEIVWALQGFYGYERSQVVAAIRALLDVSEFEVECSEEVHAAVADFEKSTVGFADCLLARTNASAGCDHTVTFDRKAAKLPGFKLLSAR